LTSLSFRSQIPSLFSFSTAPLLSLPITKQSHIYSPIAM
jgi:hypothetical protein